MKLFENKPAQRFEDGHLLGNGSLGATVYGGVIHEQILINEDTLWSGEEHNKINPQTRENFHRARSLVLDGKYREANELINEKMVGNWSESYMPLGFVHLTYDNTSDLRDMGQKRFLNNEVPFDNYRRELELDDATEHVTYEQCETKYSREYFVSRPDNVFVAHLSSQGPRALSFSVALDSPLRYNQQVNSDTSLSITGRAPDKVESYNPQYDPHIVYRSDEESNAIRFAMSLKIAATDGTVHTDGLRLYVADATYADIEVAAVTNYKGYKQPRDKSFEPLLAECNGILQAASAEGFNGLKQRHVEDYRKLYDRFGVSLGAPDDAVTQDFPTSDRLRYFKAVADPSLSALVMQYARYLLIASSRPGTEPMHLQGIWNPNPCPMWASNYTVNINVQMCYWIADPLNLGELTQPLNRMMEEIADAGKRTAAETYGAQGWVMHHNTDLWRMTEVAGEDASWAWWPTAGLWMADHLWEHYRFTRDEAYLREVFPVLKGAVDFITTFACYDEKVGYYVTAPSGNPENKFIVPGGSSTRNTFDLEERAKVSRYSPDVKDLSCVSKITTLDLTMITNLLATYKQACAVLGETVKPEATALAENLPPFQIGSRGQLQEWEEDFGECTPGMPHLSPLLGVYPENVITPDQPRLYEAARIAFERRVRNGDYYGQWPGAWNLCMNARFKNATGCYMNERFMGSDLGASLLNVGYYQIDAVMGWAAGLTEMLLQSYMEYHDILPAIPSGWREGSVRGMVARGGVEYSVSWAEGVLSEFSVHCASDRTQEIRYHDHSIVVNLTGGVARRVVFDASANGGSGELRVQSNS